MKLPIGYIIVCMYVVIETCILNKPLLPHDSCTTLVQHCDLMNVIKYNEKMHIIMKESFIAVFKVYNFSSYSSELAFYHKAIITFKLIHIALLLLLLQKNHISVSVSTSKGCHTMQRISPIASMIKLFIDQKSVVLRNQSWACNQKDLEITVV